jgi:hypothetical protein
MVWLQYGVRLMGGQAVQRPSWIICLLELVQCRALESTWPNNHRQDFDPTLLRGLQQGRQLDCINKIGGKEVSAHQQDGDTGAIETSLNFGTSYIGGFDRRVIPNNNLLRSLEGSQKRVQAIEPYSIGVTIANKNVVSHSLGCVSIHTSDLLEMKFVDDNASV